MPHQPETPGDLWRRAQRVRAIARTLADQEDVARLLDYAAELEAEAKQRGDDQPRSGA